MSSVSFQRSSKNMRSPATFKSGEDVGVNSEITIICEWNQCEHVLIFFRTYVASGVALKGSSDMFLEPLDVYRDNR